MKIRMGLLSLIALIWLCSCGRGNKYSVEPDDDISETIYGYVGDVFDYMGKEECYDGAIIYKFFSGYESLTKENITLFSEATSSVFIEGNDRIIVELDVQIPGGWGGACSFQNYIPLSRYYDPDQEYEVFPELSVYCITWQDLSDPILLEPSVFTDAKDVKYLYIANKMREKADEEGIDWYSIWPDLEGIETF